MHAHVGVCTCSGLCLAGKKWWAGHCCFLQQHSGVQDGQGEAVGLQLPRARRAVVRSQTSCVCVLGESRDADHSLDLCFPLSTRGSDFTADTSSVHLGKLSNLSEPWLSHL